MIWFGWMSDISQLAISVGGGGERGSGTLSSPYHYTTWLRERGREGCYVPSPWPKCCSWPKFCLLALSTFPCVSSSSVAGIHCSENPIYAFLFWKLHGAQSQFLHSCVCEQFIHSQDWCTYFMQQNRLIDCVGYINRSQTHEYRNWDCCRAIPFLGIFVSNFQYWFFAVYTRTSCHPST